MKTKVVKEWMQLQAQLKEIKAREMSLRKEICSAILKDTPLPVRKKYEVNGLVLEVDGKVTYSLDATVVNSLFDDLEDADKSSLDFKPSLKLREYKKLPESSLLHEAVTIKPAAPVLKIISMKV